MEPRDLPSVTKLVELLGVDLDVPEPLVVEVARRALDDARRLMVTSGEADPVALARTHLAGVAAMRPRVVVNATGILLHTNLGRAPIRKQTADAAAAIAAASSNVEIDLRSGRRSKRNDYLAHLLPLVTGAESGFAVNNNAGALLLALASVADRGRKVAVSRGELIEIGGSFRLPQIMAASGAELVEVGTTNRTRLADYEQVVDDVDAILKVHPSNYRIEGFREEATFADVARLATSAGIPFVADIGSGLIDEAAPWLGDGDRSWLAGEPGVIQTVATGADLVLFSGDKLLGGPQAGIIVGSTPTVAAAASHPIARAVRLDGAAIAAIADTLECYLDKTVPSIPFWRMAAASVADITARASAVIDGLAVPAVIESGRSIPGAGSVPGATIPTSLIRLSGDADAVWTHLAGAQVPVIGTRRDGAVFLDLRSVLPEDDATVRSALTTLTS